MPISSQARLTLDPQTISIAPGTELTVVISDLDPQERDTFMIQVVTFFMALTLK